MCVGVCVYGSQRNDLCVCVSERGKKKKQQCASFVSIEEKRVFFVCALYVLSVSHG